MKTKNTIGIAIIGAGERGVYYVGSRIAEAAADCELRIVGVCDIVPGRAALAAAHLDGLYAATGVDHKTRVFDDLETTVSDPAVDMVIITTHTDQHRTPVERAVAHCKRIYLDKPISVTFEDALAIAEAERKSGQPIMMGFTRRYEQSWIDSVDLSRSGRIGQPRMVMLRSLIPYSRYLQLWHRNESRSGGALNDKGSHHFDVLNWVANGATAVRLTAIGGRSGIFTPHADAPERCSLCDLDCPYRRHETLIDQSEGVGRIPNDSWIQATEVHNWNDTCVYHPGADIDDHSVVTVQYDNGLVATHFFAIFGPWATDMETLEILGDQGRLRMERHSGEIDLVEDYGYTRGVIEPDPATRDSTHYGADRQLVREIVNFMQGTPPPVGVREGVESMRLVAAAKLSLAQGGVPIDPRNFDLIKETAA